MTVRNADVARIFARLADLLEIEGANPFRVRAYRDAARIVGDVPQRWRHWLRLAKPLRAARHRQGRGRLLNKRGPFEVDLERVMRAALERGCFLELNAQPDRLDLNDAHCKMAKELGLKLAISTDAHSVANLDLMRFGIDQARRGWLEPADVLNTRSWPQLKKLLRRA